jgi:hypothetical protein
MTSSDARLEIPSSVEAIDDESVKPKRFNSRLSNFRKQYKERRNARFSSQPMREVSIGRDSSGDEIRVYVPSSQNNEFVSRDGATFVSVKFADGRVFSRTTAGKPFGVNTKWNEIPTGSDNEIVVAPGGLWRSAKKKTGTSS